MNKYRLISNMKNKGHTYASLAEVVGISQNGFTRKINGYNDFTLPEIRIIADELGMDKDEMYEVFFS